jgi:hypothetical protein
LWPCPIAARTGAAQELGLGWGCGRLIPVGGSIGCRWQRGAGPRLSPFDWAVGSSVCRSLRRRLRVPRARGRRAWRSCAPLRALRVGCRSARGSRSRSRRPGLSRGSRRRAGRPGRAPSVGAGSLLGELGAALRLGRLEHDRVEAGNADDLVGAAEAAGVADLGQQVAGNHGADAVDLLQGDEPAVAAGERSQLPLDLRHLLRGRVDHRDVCVDERTHVPVEREPVEPAPSVCREQPAARAGPALLLEDGVQPLRPAGAIVAERLPQPGQVAQPLHVLGRDPRARAASPSRARARASAHRGGRSSPCACGPCARVCAGWRMASDCVKWPRPRARLLPRNSRHAPPTYSWTRSRSDSRTDTRQRLRRCERLSMHSGTAATTSPKQFHGFGSPAWWRWISLMTNAGRLCQRATSKSPAREGCLASCRWRFTRGSTFTSSPASSISPRRS